MAKKTDMNNNAALAAGLGKKVDKPDGLSEEENFAWAACAFMAANGHEAEVAYKDGDENSRGQLAGVRCEDGTVVPISVTIRAARPYVDVNNITVLRGAAVGPKTLQRFMDAVLCERPKVAKREKESAANSSYNKDMDKVKAYVTNGTGWGVGQDYSSRHSSSADYDAAKLTLAANLAFSVSLSDLLALQDTNAAADLTTIIQTAKNEVTELLKVARAARAEKLRGPDLED